MTADMGLLRRRVGSPAAGLAAVALPLLLMTACGGAPETATPEPAVTPEVIVETPGNATLASRPPVAVFPETSHDFGLVAEGERVEHRFLLRNEGGAELVIEKVTATEPLAVTRFDAALPPGDEGAVELAFDTAGSHGWGSVAAVAHTNDPRRSQVRLTLTGEVAGGVEIEPHSRLYFFATRGEGATKERTLVNHRDEPLALTAATSDNPLLHPRLETLEEGRRWRLVVELDPEAPVGRIDGRVTVATGDAELPGFGLPVLAVISERIVVRPAEVNFGKIERKSLEHSNLRRRRVGVSRGDDPGFEVHSAECDLPFISVELASEGPGRWVVELEIDPERVSVGEVSGTLTLRTGDPELPELEVPVHGDFL